MNVKDKNKFSSTQQKVAYSLACAIRSVLYSEYYKQNENPNTLQIIAKLRGEYKYNLPILELKHLGENHFLS